ncbi:RHS repeat-associated core domain-containing protein, partial [Paraburkholderia antibiotica]|uniref:RHS repeat-associated core domain-containing protein n=1 Tax=Paraburkholderia antibiotica TaxID=2728839 RepID=UPI002E31E321
YRAWGGVKPAPYGKADPVGADNRIRFQGQYHDEETGLAYNRHRYYDAQNGRFISKDPIGLAGGVNVYQYAPNPVQWVDPLGLDRITNAVEGARREDVFNAQMRAKHPNATVQCQCYLRNAQGQSVKDPVTGERRRVDTAVIENGQAQTYEVTSPTADKTAQLDKETNILNAGGTYVRDRTTGQLAPVNGLSEIVRLP